MYLMFCENYTEYLNGKYIYLSVCGRNSKYSKDKKNMYSLLPLKKIHDIQRPNTRTLDSL